MKMKLVLLAQPLIDDVTALRRDMACTPVSMGSVSAMPHLRLRSVLAIFFFRIGQRESGQFICYKTGQFYLLTTHCISKIIFPNIGKADPARPFLVFFAAILY
jgi:hypothetical protein